jgi:hypothetical protein
MQRLIISLAIALGALVPAVAFAQTSTTGLLTVYVQVLSQTGVTYQTYTPGNFTVLVSGQSPSLTNFPGSQSGTAVLLNTGAYNVTVTNAVAGYAPSYSVGCNSSISSGQSQTCVITMTPSYGYNQYPTQYPYQQYTQPLTCQTLTPTVALGQQASFNAVGGQGGTYNWATAYQNYPNVGPTLTTSFQASGSQVVTVTNAAQTATCTITVTNSYSPSLITYPTYPSNTTYPGAYNTYPTITSTLYPQLPRTGFGPKDAATGAAFAVVLLIAAGLITAPYVRKTVTALSR